MVAFALIGHGIVSGEVRRGVVGGGLEHENIMGDWSVGADGRDVASMLSLELIGRTASSGHLGMRARL